MEMHAMHGDQITHVLSIHRDEKDHTPVQMISAARLAYYMTLEQAVLTFVESVAKVLPSVPPE